MGCSPHLQFDSHYSWTHDSKSPGIATIMVGPGRPMQLSTHRACLDSIPSRCWKQSSYRISRRHRSLQVRGMGCSWRSLTWMWMVGKMGDTDRWKNIYNILLINDPSWQIRSGLHTNWTRHNDRTNVIATVCLIWYTHTQWWQGVRLDTTGNSCAFLPEAVKLCWNSLQASTECPHQSWYYNATAWDGIFAI